jgi:hypothetical protein
MHASKPDHSRSSRVFQAVSHLLIEWHDLDRCVADFLEKSVQG